MMGEAVDHRCGRSGVSRCHGFDESRVPAERRFAARVRNPRTRPRRTTARSGYILVMSLLNRDPLRVVGSAPARDQPERAAVIACSILSPLTPPRNRTLRVSLFLECLLRSDTALWCVPLFDYRRVLHKVCIPLNHRPPHWGPPLMCGVAVRSQPTTRQPLASSPG